MLELENHATIATFDIDQHKTYQQVLNALLLPERKNNFRYRPVE